MKFIKTVLSVIGVNPALASEVVEELQCEDKSLAQILEDQNEAQNHQRCQKSKSNTFSRC